VDFEFSAKTRDYLQRLGAFMDEHIYPNEERFYAQLGEGNRWQEPPLLEELQHKARAAQLWNLFLPDSHHGAGLSNLEYAPLCEMMGRVRWSSEVFNCSAPDTGNMETLERYGTPAQKKQWLEPLLNGAIRSAFAMTEPRVASSDATNIESSIVRDGASYVINGRKWWTSGAGSARCRLFIFMGKTDPGAPQHRQQSMILVPRDTPGVSVAPLESIDQTRRPCEVVFRNVDVPKSARIADERKCGKVVSRVIDAACVVLAADSLGGAQRALEMSVEYSKMRQQFGRPIGSFQAVKHLAAEMVSDIEPSRSLLWYAAYAYDAEPRTASRAAAMAKARLSDVYARTTNRAVQIHGGIGFTWEHDMHLWFKRAKWNETAFGDATYHRERLAQLAGF